MSKENSLSQDKLDWMNEVGMKEFEEPVKYHSRIGGLYSERYIRVTPLEELKARYQMQVPYESLDERDGTFD